MKKVFLLLAGALIFVISGCEKLNQSEVEHAPTILNTKMVDDMRFPGEIEVPKDVYKKAYEEALKNITIQNMEERLTLLENEITQEVAQQ